MSKYKVGDVVFDYKVRPTPRYIILLAKIFGKKIVTEDRGSNTGCVTTAYLWKGNIYVTDMTYITYDD